MNSKKRIAHEYLLHLEKNEMDKVIALFHKDGLVDSPVYGQEKAAVFYQKLRSDTLNSQLSFKGFYDDVEGNSFALYFKYKWTLKNGKELEFDVVDIFELDAESRIVSLKIIYDSTITRAFVKGLNEE
ncbi:MAG: nuclear transport factor 2 family protein [Bacteroidota bacterium]